MNAASRIVTPDGKTVFSVDSRATIELDLSELMVGGELAIFREVEDLGLLSFRFQRRKVIVAAGGFIGLIPLTPSITVEVRPKLPVRNLARVLDVAGSSLKPLSTADRLYLTNDEATGSILEFLGRNLLDAIRPLEALGLHKDYLRKSRATTHPTGRVDLSSSLKRFWSRGVVHKVIAERFEQTSDVSVNRVVSAALRFLLQRLKSTSPTTLFLAKQANQTLLRLPASVAELGPGDVESARDIIRRRSLPAQREYYYRALEISLLILSNGGISLQEKGNDVLLRSFVVNFDDLFENYVRRVLQSFGGNMIAVLDGNKEGKQPLFQNGKKFWAQPDIVLKANASGKRIVADVKYKDGPRREDINQGVTYAVSYATDRVLIIYQSKPGEPKGLQHIGKMGAIVVDGYAFDLGSADLATEEKLMADQLFALTS